MGMSASQARLLSLTSRMHDLEYEAQALQYSKLDLADIKNKAYDEYEEALDSTKFQMTMVTADGKEYQDITYQNMIVANERAVQSLYTLKEDASGKFLMP